MRRLLSLRSLAWPGIVLSIALWGAAAYVWSNAYPAPIELLGGDKVEPRHVKPGGVVTVTRNMRFLREEDVKVSRVMIRGDCSKACEIIDMPSGNLALVPGEYRNFQREHVVPATATPGTWRLVFTMQWKKSFGRTVNQHLPDLTFEVIP